MTASNGPNPNERSRSASATVPAPTHRTESILPTARANHESEPLLSPPAILSATPTCASRAIPSPCSKHRSPAPLTVRKPDKHRAGQTPTAFPMRHARVPGSDDTHRSPDAGHTAPEAQSTFARVGRVAA